MVGSAMTELSPIVDVSVVLRKEDMVRFGYPRRKLEQCGFALMCPKDTNNVDPEQTSVPT